MNFSATKSGKKNSRDFEYAVQLTRLLLLPLGLWPTESKIYQKILRPIAIVLCLFIMLFVIIPLCLFMFIVVQDLGIRLKLIAPVAFGLINLFKYLVMIFKNREIAACFSRMSIDWQELRSVAERKIMMDNAKTARFFTTICAFFMYGAGMQYIAVLPLTKGVVVRGNVSYRHLAYPSYFIFFNPQVRPIYDFVFTAHCMCGLVRYTVTCGVYSIAILCVMHICSQITITTSMLERLVENFDYKLLEQIVNQHLHFLKFAAQLEEIFNEICLVEMLSSSCMICFLGYYLITEYEQRETIATFTYFLFLISFIFNIFILCYIGQILTEQCNSIGTSAYMVNWYQLPIEEARNILFLIISTQRPVFLTAGKMVNLSFQSFSNVIKASASYLNMLRTLTAN